MSLTDLAQNLAFLFAIVPHEIVNRGIARRAMTGCRNITISVPEYRSNGFVVTTLIIGDEIYPIPFLFIENNFWKLINLEFLVLWRVGIIKSPLLERDVSTDKMN